LDNRVPLIDVTELLYDPDIAGQGFTVIRRQEIVNNFGESVVIEQRIPGLAGSVQPSGDNSLIREDAYDAQADSIHVACVFRLRGVAQVNNTRFKPDIILWNGNTYEVMVVNSWDQFGQGFIDAEATSIKYLDTADPPSLPPLVGQLNFTRTANAVYAHGAMMGGI
jgi:hypothetical protein